MKNKKHFFDAIKDHMDKQESEEEPPMKRQKLSEENPEIKLTSLSTLKEVAPNLDPSDMDIIIDDAFLEELSE